MGDSIEEAARLRAGYGVLWGALADIVESKTTSPNSTVRRIIARAEQGLIEDPFADVKPVPEFFTPAHSKERD